MNITNPAFDYDSAGQHYSGYRQTDPRIALHVFDVLKGARTVLNIGAGAGSYEPPDQYVIAVEPSSEMRGQRQRLGKSPAIIGKADQLPFDDGAFDAAMAMLTVHHWPDIAAGLREVRRVTRKQIVILTYDPEALHVFWNAAYFPELIAVEMARYPSIDFLKNTLGGHCDVIPVSIPLDCVDGFQEAFYGRPEAFLQKEVRMSQSAWGFLSAGVEERLVGALELELKSGDWDRKYGHYRTQPFFEGALRLVVASP